MLLKLRHWQLFVMIIGLPLIIQIVLMVIFAVTHDSTWLVILLPVVAIVSLGSFFSWFYSLGNGLYKKLPPKVDLNIRFFRISIFLPVVYIFLFIGFMLISLFLDKGEPNLYYFFAIIPIHFFMMFCVVYQLYFISKSLKSVELQREVTFNDYSSEFFLIWFYPIGVWFIQPRVNRLFESTK